MKKSKKHSNKKKQTQIKIKEKRAWRTTRSRLKARLRKGASIKKELFSKYHLQKTNKNFYNNVKEREPYDKRLSVPENFCFIENIDESMKFLEKIISIRETVEKNRTIKLHISYKDTKLLGLIPSYLFDKEIERLILERGRKFRISGEVSPEKEINNFLFSFGLLKKLKLTPTETTDLYDRDHENRSFRFMKEGSKNNKQEKRKASEDLANLFDDCLKTKNFQLIEKHKSNLIGSIGELIDNAEEHGDGQWVAIGYYDKEKEHCRFAIFNEGKSIFETLSKEGESTQSETLNEIIKKHTPIMRKLDVKYKECFWCVSSLQEGISSKRTPTGTDSSRGQGFMDVLEFIQSLDEKSSVFNLVSGHSSIRVDAKYKILKGNDQIRRIIFNDKGDFARPMDPEKVFSIQKPLKGVAISGQFKIDGIIKRIGV